jgi:hypothetical protein
VEELVQSHGRIESNANAGRAKDRNAEVPAVVRRIFAFSAISHGYIRDLWADFDSISRRGLFSYCHPEYVRWLMLHLDSYCTDAITQIYLPRILRRDERRDREMVARDAKSRRPSAKLI